MKLQLRFATEADLPDILDIVNHAIGHTTANYDEAPHTIEMQSKWFAEKNAEGFPVIVAIEENKVAGFGTYGRFRPKTGYRFTVEHSVYVSHELIGKGIGKQILSRLIELAKEQQFHVMIGVIDASNTGSIAFHQQFGFVETGVLRQVGFKFGKWLDISIMQLMLD